MDILGDQNDEVELCSGGQQKCLTRENASEYVELMLQSYTRLDQLQFQALYEGFEDTVTKKVLSITPAEIAKKRTCSSSEINVDAFKASTEIEYDDGNYAETFWEIIREITNKERQMVLKFMTGRTRLQPGQT